MLLLESLFSTSYQQRPLTLCHEVYKFLRGWKECAQEEEFLLGKFCFGDKKKVERSLVC